MVRPKLASDDEILDAAAKVMAERGPQGFTVTAVAAEVGLSRAAILSRFKGVEELKVALTNEMIGPLKRALEAIPGEPGGDGLIAVARCIGRHVSSREGSAQFFVGMSHHVMDGELRQLERSRGEIVRQAIAKVMPVLSVDHDVAVTLFRAHIAGSMLAWLSSDDDDPATYLIVRTRQWLQLMKVPYTEACCTLRTH